MGKRFGGFIRKEVRRVSKRHCPVSRTTPFITEEKNFISSLQGGYTRESIGSCGESAFTHL